MRVAARVTVDVTKIDGEGQPSVEDAFATAVDCVEWALDCAENTGFEHEREDTHHISVRGVSVVY